MSMSDYRPATPFAWPARRTDGRMNPLSPQWDPIYTKQQNDAAAFATTPADDARFDAYTARLDADEPVWIPVCGKTGEAMTREQGCLVCGCYAR